MKKKVFPFIRYYKTTNGVFASLLLDEDKYSIEIILKKGYKTEKSAKATLEKIGKDLGLFSGLLVWE